jgi:hypothetical protein
MTSINVERIGRRSYLRGNTYPIKDQLRSAGAHWDGEQRAWWIGDHAKAVELAGGAQSGDSGSEQPRNADQLSADARIAGKARYKGREYLLVWEGATKRGRAAKLAFTDGSKVFWANAGEYEVTKIYESRESSYRGGRSPTEHMTFGRLQRLREKYARARKEGAVDDGGRILGTRYECPECGEYVTAGQGSCWETGCAH